MKIILKGHDHRYAAEQMLLTPHGIFYSVGAPVYLNYRGPEMNSVPLRATRRGRVGSTEGGALR